jgi:hypothetical protein
MAHADYPAQTAPFVSRSSVSAKGDLDLQVSASRGVLILA